MGKIVKDMISRKKRQIFDHENLFSHALKFCKIYYCIYMYTYIYKTHLRNHSNSNIKYSTYIIHNIQCLHWNFPMKTHDITTVICIYFNVNIEKLSLKYLIKCILILLSYTDSFKVPTKNNQTYSQEKTPNRVKKIANRSNSNTLVLRSGKISPSKNQEIDSPSTSSTFFKNLSLSTTKESLSGTFLDATSSSIPLLDIDNKKRNRSTEQEQPESKKADKNDSFTKQNIVPIAQSTPGSTSSLETTSQIIQSSTIKRKMSTSENQIIIHIVHFRKPLEILTNDEMVDIMKKIDLQMDGLSDEEEGKVDIDKVTYTRAGFIKLCLNNEYTLSWLEKRINEINYSFNTTVQVKIEKIGQEEKFIKVKVRILDRKIDETLFFKKIRAGNPDLDVSKWYVIKSVSLKDDQMLVIFKIDQESFEKLKSKNDPFQIKYGAFGKIKVILDEKPENSGEPAKKQSRTIGSKDVQI